MKFLCLTLYQLLCKKKTRTEQLARVRKFLSPSPFRPHPENNCNANRSAGSKLILLELLENVCTCTNRLLLQQEFSEGAHNGARNVIKANIEIREFPRRAIHGDAAQFVNYTIVNEIFKLGTSFSHF